MERGISSHFCSGGAAESLGDVESIENVSLVKLHTVSAENPQELRLEVLLPMVFGLSRDVVLHGSFLRLADRKNAVTLLPRKFAECRICIMHPLGRARLNRAQQVGNRCVRTPAEIEMDVVLHASDVKENVLFGANDSADVRVQSFGEFGRDPGPSAFC